MNDTTNSRRKCCVIYLKGRVEHQTAWYSDASRAQRALSILRRRYGDGNAIIYRD